MKRGIRKHGALLEIDPPSLVNGWIILTPSQKDAMYEAGELNASMLPSPDERALPAYVWLQKRMHISTMPIIVRGVPPHPDQHKIAHWPPGITGNCYCVSFTLPENEMTALVADAWYTATDRYYVPESDQDDIAFEESLPTPQLKDPFFDERFHRQIIGSWDRILRVTEMQGFYGKDLLYAVTSIPESAIRRVQPFVIPNVL